MEHYEKLQKKGENIYIDSLTYDEFMLLGDLELSRRFSELEEESGKEKLNRSQDNELEYSQEPAEEVETAKNVMEFAQAYQQQDSSAMNSALKGIVAGVMMQVFPLYLLSWVSKRKL